MNNDAAGRAGIPPLVVLLFAVVLLVIGTTAVATTLVGPHSRVTPGGMTGGGRAGMMSGSSTARRPSTGLEPRAAGFVAGTAASPRVIRVIAGPGYTFDPSTITVARGETITFVVTAMGPLVHEFMVGRADAVAADAAGTPEVAGIAMMQTRSLTYTFDGAGPYAFACHATGHYEAGMRGTVVVVG